ncbi:MAG: hypothetical protein LW829_08935, partial [Luteolibacter sp.]|nr:hypothetical protein [Luteolibacter sp.]
LDLKEVVGNHLKYRRYCSLEEFILHFMYHRDHPCLCRRFRANHSELFRKSMGRKGVFLDVALSE